MAKGFTKKVLPILAILLLTPWPIAYAYDNAATAQETVQVQAADSLALPSWSVFGRAIGGVTTPGDLFYIDAGDYVADIAVTLHVTNTQELLHYYRYLILKIGIYVESNSGGWKKATGHDNELIPDTFITLRNAQVSFTLTGYANYKVTIDSGNFYYFAASAANGSASPQFYLSVD